MSTISMLTIPLKIDVVRNMPVPHEDSPGFFVDFAAVKGNSSGVLHRSDFPGLTKDEFLQKGLDELNNGENKAFVAVYTDSSQSDISHLVFKDKLDSMYKKPESKTGQQVYLLDKDLIPERVLCVQACEEPTHISAINSWMTKDDAIQVLERANRQFFNSFGIDFELLGGEIRTSYFRSADAPNTLTFLGEVNRPDKSDRAAFAADKRERRIHYNNVVNNLFLDKEFTNSLPTDDNSVNLYFLTFTGNTRQGNAGVGKDDEPRSHKVVMGQWTNKSNEVGNTMLRKRNIYLEEGSPSLVFTFSHELGHILGENHTDRGSGDFMESTASLLVATDEQKEGMRSVARRLRASFGLPEEPILNNISGTKKKNKLIGTGGNDEIFGMRGRDRLTGLEGHDVLNGGRGRDKLFGGAGRDIFVVSNGKDIVEDFSSEDHDKILVDRIYENLDIKTSKDRKSVILTTDVGVFKIKNTTVEAVEAAIVVDEILL